MLHRKTWSWFGILFIWCAAFVAIGYLWAAQPANCAWCVPTFCGFSSDCPPNCHCAIPWGRVTGRCSG